MARNLRVKAPADDTLVIFDVNKDATKRFVDELGVTSKNVVASKLDEVVDRSDTIITMLPGPQHVKSVFNSFLNASSSPAGREEKLFIDCSTIDISTSLSVRKTVCESSLNGQFVDAPVSGGTVGAAAGTLTFMVGSEPALLPRITPLLSLMGSRVIHCGPPGAGLAGKLTNNYLLSISNIATAEAMNLGIKLGLDGKVLKDLINVSSGRCWSSEINNPVDTAQREFKGGFGVSLMKKDLKLAIQAAEEIGAKLAMGERAREVYEAVEGVEECKGRDFSVVYRWLGGDEGKK
ncbi:NAD binding domain of 6-phosphogluconate dehydrogenase-domain-containing protein [Tuber borchii]|uniref:3-hydroxyisobutyrate dehydrogenase n=1 Tax=Tuber borchii TaxID=42251 RepID=A0A2T6ZHL2_TUBBO|nr:NAD binding domain of 6-phosphogluconate dehydrogenase-domain-containing protein [Tuber borchii]